MEGEAWDIVFWWANERGDIGRLRMMGAARLIMGGGLLIVFLWCRPWGLLLPVIDCRVVWCGGGVVVVVRILLARLRIDGVGCGGRVMVRLRN